MIYSPSNILKDTTMIPIDHTHRSLLKKAVQISIGIFFSKFLGLARKNLLINFLGVTALADAFNFANTLSNTLRKFFAEGALNAALAPSIVTTLHKSGTRQVSALITLMLFIFQPLLFLFCFFLKKNMSSIISFAAPGFLPEQTAAALSITQSLIFLIVGSSAAVIFATALQSVNRFLLSASSQVITNFLFITQLLYGIYYNYSIELLIYSTLCNSILIVIFHVIAYKAAGFTFALPSKETFLTFISIGKKFIPSIITIGSLEMSLFIDRIFVSYLPTGSFSTLDYTLALIDAPLAMIAHALATVLLPHMSYIVAHKSQRINFYLLEFIKLIMWITLPLVIFMVFFSKKITSTLFSSSHFTSLWHTQTAHLLSIFALGILFFSINRIVTNILYAFHDTIKPTSISLFCTMLNTLLNAITIQTFGITGISLSTVCSECIKTFLLIAALIYGHKVTLDIKRLGTFFAKTCFQLCSMILPFYGIYKASSYGISALPAFWSHLLLQTLGFWVWVGPLFLLFFITLYFTRRQFKIRLYFL